LQRSVALFSLSFMSAGLLQGGAKKKKTQVGGAGLPDFGRVKWGNRGSSSMQPIRAMPTAST